MSETPTKHVTMTPKKPVDHKENFSKPYYTFNAGCLDDEKWTDRDLQKLCVKLGISIKGTREEIIARLINWHRYPQNPNRRCAGSNFMLLEVNVSPTNKAGSQNGACPTYLSPLKCKPKRNADGSPVSILSAKKEKTPKKSLKFSLFNGTKLIPPREAIHHQWLREEGIADPEAWLEEDSDDDLDDISQQIAQAGSGSHAVERLLGKTDNKTDLAQDDWLASDLNLPKDSPYHKNTVSRTATVTNSSSQHVGRTLQFAEDDGENNNITYVSAPQRIPTPNAKVVSAMKSDTNNGTPVKYGGSSSSSSVRSPAISSRPLYDLRSRSSSTNQDNHLVRSMAGLSM